MAWSDRIRETLETEEGKQRFVQQFAVMQEDMRRAAEAVTQGYADVFDDPTASEKDAIVRRVAELLNAVRCETLAIVRKCEKRNS